MMLPPPGFEGDMAQKHALPMRVDGCFNLEPILYVPQALPAVLLCNNLNSYQNIMDSDYNRSMAKLVT